MLLVYLSSRDKGSLCYAGYFASGLSNDQTVKTNSVSNKLEVSRVRTGLMQKVDQTRMSSSSVMARRLFERSPVLIGLDIDIFLE